MKNTLLFQLFLIATLSYSQKSETQSTFLSTSLLEEEKNDSIKNVFGIKSPVFFVNNYSDKSGNYFIVFTQQMKPEYADKDSHNNSIRFLNLKSDSGRLFPVWDYTVDAMPDFLMGTQAIHFNKELISFSDLDEDSLIDPIIAYTTKTKLDILIFHNKKPVSIELSFKISGKRKFNVDRSFYDLPLKMQNSLINKLEIAFEIFPDEFPFKWKSGFQKKKLIIT